ncbi:MAG: DNA recombination protein RmuC [bacterium]
MQYIMLVIGLVIGGVIAYLFVKANSRQNTVGVAQEKYDALMTEKTKAEENARILENRKAELTAELGIEREKANKAQSALVGKDAEFKSLETRLTESKQDMETLQEKFTKEFELISRKMLEETGKKFTDQNSVKIDELLKPLKEKIGELQTKTEIDGKDRAGLKAEIKQMFDLNKQMSDDTNNLTRALKGESKTQGNWGEVTLELILEKSGMVEGREYTREKSITSQEAKTYRPDVIIELPDNKHIVIDSKVSLSAYERYSSSEGDEKDIALKEHILSIDKHIKELSEKKYQNLEGVNSPDFVFMFVPVEPALAVAIQNSPGIYEKAMEKNIVILSPSLLIPALRIVANIWKFEDQDKRAGEIIKKAGDLYDKFVGFLTSMQEIGVKLGHTQKSYEDAMGKLKDGSGNIIKKVEGLKESKIVSAKQIPKNLLEE